MCYFYLMPIVQSNNRTQSKMCVWFVFYSLFIIISALFFMRNMIETKNDRRKKTTALFMSEIRSIRFGSLNRRRWYGFLQLSASSFNQPCCILQHTQLNLDTNCISIYISHVLLFSSISLCIVCCCCCHTIYFWVLLSQ